MSFKLNKSIHVCVTCYFLQISVAIKKILYAADAKESALEEAQAYINQTVDAVEDQPETEA